MSLPETSSIDTLNGGKKLRKSRISPRRSEAREPNKSQRSGGIA